MNRWSCFGILALALAGFPAQAHHSIAGMYHRDQQVSLSGVIVEFRFVQPHAFLVLDADPDETGPQRWHLEMDNHRELVQVGVTAETFGPGDEVIVSGDRARNGQQRLYLRQLHRPADGLRYEQPGFRPSLRAP